MMTDEFAMRNIVARKRAGALASLAPPPPPPLYLVSAREPEPARGIWRVARRLTAACAATLLLTLAAALAPQDARAQQQPAAPTLSLTSGDYTVQLRWNQIAGVTGWEYQYKFGTGSYGDWISIPTFTTTVKFLNIQNAHAGLLYTVRLRAVKNGVKGAITEKTATPTGTSSPPLTATAGDGQVTLAWTYTGSSGFERWAYRQKEGDGAYGDHQPIPGGTAIRTHTVTGLTNGATYTFYVIRADTLPGAGLTFARPRSFEATATLPLGVTVSPTLLMLGEGESRTYTVKLDTKPAAAVTVTVGGAGDGVTASPSSLTFTTGDYGVAQTVTVSAAADENADDENVELTHAASSGDAAYGSSLSVDSVEVEVSDVTPTLQLLTDPADATEGENISLTITSDKARTGDLTVRLRLAARGGSSSFDAADIEGALGLRNFVAEFGTSMVMTATVMIETVLDSEAETNQDYRIALEDGPGYAVGDDVEADGTLVDPTLSSKPAKPKGLTATAGDGRVTLSWTDPEDATISAWQYRQRKGSGGWGGWTDVPGSGATTRSHAVTGLDNDAEYTFRVRARNSAGAGPQSNQESATPTATVAGGRPAKPAGLVAMAGDGQVTLSWNALPGFTITSWGYEYKESSDVWGPSATTPGTVSDGGATSATVSGLTNGTEYTFRLYASAGSGASTLRSVWSNEVKATPTAAPGVILSRSELTVAEDGTKTYTVRLNAKPEGGVTVAPSSSDPGAATASGSLAFTTANWSMAQTVSVSGVQDNDVGDEEVTVSHAVSGYGSVTAGSVTVTVEDDDAASATVSTAALTVAEGGSGSYTVVLGAEPSAAVTVSVGGASGDVSATPTRLTFTTASWSTAQAVTVSAAQDDDTMPDPPTRLTHSATGGGYDAVAFGSVSVSVTEDDPGGTVAPTELTVVEGGSAAYTVVLHIPPPEAGDVVVSVSGASGDVSAAPTSLTFTAASWSTARTVTVSAAPDEDAEAEAAVTLTHAIAGGGYDAATLSAVSVSVSETTPILQLSMDPSVTAEGEAIRLTVASDKAVTGMLTVRLRLSAREESGFDAEDVEGGLGPRDFQADFGAEAGMTGIVLIPTAGDQGSEGEEAYRVELLAGTGYAVGADALADGIVSDRLGAAARASRVNAAALPQALAAAVAQATGVIAQRIELAASGVEPEALDLGAALASGAGADGAGLDWRAALSGMALATGLTGADGSRVASAWVRGALSSLDGSEDGVSWDGEVWSAHAGVDFRARPDVLAGVAASYAEGDLDTEADGVRGRHETRLASVRPYVAWLLEDGSSVWASASYGRGKVRVREDGQATREADLRTRSASAGGWRTLSERSGAGGDVLRLALRGEGSLARARTDAEDGLEGLSVDASRVRLALEGSRERVLEDGGRLTPALEAGARYDGGDATDGAGAELGASVSYLDGTGRMSVELRTRALVAHEADRDEWSASARMSVTPEASGRGPSLRLSLGRGDAGSGLARLFAREGSSARLGEAEARTRLEAEVGQGLSGPWASLVTPYAGLSVEESGLALLRLGTRYRRGETLALALEAETGDESRIALRASLRW